VADSIETLLKKDLIIGVINDLFVGTDNRDWMKVKRCFADKVLFDMTSLSGGSPTTMTPQQIVDAWDQGLKALKATHHQAGNYSVTVQGHEAAAHCYGIAYHYLPNETNQNTRTFVGSYEFHLTNRDQNWRIDQFKFNLKFIDGNSNLENSR
jgi:3-phenylpropionate/cinnamic acid dioxygenase small subunit